MQRAVLPWLLVLALLVGGFGATVAAVNNDVLSAHGFVRAYLEALQRHDVNSALEMPGVAVDGDDSLITDSVVGNFSDVRFLSDTAKGDRHEVRYSYLINGERTFTDFSVVKTGTRLALFSTWAFAASPIATLTARADHDSVVTVNGTVIAAGTYPVLVPGLYVADDDSTLFVGEADAIPVTETAQKAQGLVHVTATAAFTTAAQDAVHAFLDDCTTQQVLMPTGCPFGTAIANRLTGVPEWSVVDYPQLSLTPEAAAGTWRARASGGSVAMTAHVQSLFDGSLSTVRDSVPLAADYLVVLNPDGTMTVTTR